MLNKNRRKMVQAFQCSGRIIQQTYFLFVFTFLLIANKKNYLHFFFLFVVLIIYCFE